MKLERFTEAAITAHASRACEYFAARPADTVWRVQMMVQRDLSLAPPHDLTADAAPIQEIKRPAIQGAGGLGEAIKVQASFWDIFNQIFIQHARVMGDR